MPAAQTGALLRHYVEHNNVEQVRLLLTKRSSPLQILDDADCNGTTALHLAARHGCRDIVDLLCSAGAFPNVSELKLVGGNTPLHYASESGDPGVVLIFYFKFEMSNLSVKS